MHVFAVFALFAFGVMGLTMLGERVYRQSRELRVALALAVGIALAWLSAFDMWPAWHVALRYGWVGTTLTGVALGGAATFLHAVTAFFAGLHRKFDDQAEVLEHHELRKAA
jgi:hypothetical protein